ncbi:hypothetical protein C1646_760589 [Rhizophagus diaphanus]|nr:hypothetical protein C1646_760589 [Rhizophagus diaphanus] [Rhizophagus sp. MUCL 43196]
MSFHRPHPRQRRICEEHKAELEKENYHLHSELQTEYEQEIQNLNRKIERLENTSEEEVMELKSEISSLKSQLYQARKDVQNKGKYISDLKKRLVESEEQVERLQYRVRTISSRKNSPERGNSPNLYNPNINLEMAIITELANAIDGFLDNTADRVIMSDQIKRATRQIRQKENNLHQDLVREQRRLYEQYEKWKNKTQAERQNNLNLQAQILALQNNPPNQINMAGIPHPYFDWDDSIPDFLAQLRLDLHNRGIDPNDNVAGPPTERDNAIGHLRGWQANLVAVNGRTAVQIGVNALNEAVSQPGNAIVKLRAVEDAWNEDWRIAGGRPTNTSVNAPNANAENTVVVAGIRFGQAIWWLKTHFPTVEEKLQDMMYRIITKGDMTIDELYRKIVRIGRRANYRPEELCRKFLDALSLPWLEKAEDIGKHLPLAELAKKLYEIELRQIARHKRNKLFNPLVSNRASQQIYEPLPVSALQQHGISLEDMQKAIQNVLTQQKTENQALVKKVTELQSQMAQQMQVSASQTVKPVRQPKGPPSSLKTEEDSDYPIKPFQRSRPQRNNNSARIDRLKERIDETCDAPLTPIVPFDSDGEENDGDGYDKADNEWYYAPEKKQVPVNDKLPLESSQLKTYDELLPKLLPTMRKICLSREAQEEKSKKDEWFSSLQYLNVKIDDLTISNSFLDSASEFRRVNDATINALEWKADKPSDFTIKATKNFTRIDNGEPEPMLCLAPEVEDPPKEKQDQVSTNSSSPNTISTIKILAEKNGKAGGEEIAEGSAEVDPASSSNDYKHDEVVEEIPHFSLHYSEREPDEKGDYGSIPAVLVIALGGEFLVQPKRKKFFIQSIEIKVMDSQSVMQKN